MPSKVFYNSACPVCNAGIKEQRSRMEACGVKDVEWIDIHTHPETVSELGEPLEKVRERLHVKNSSGRVDIGADAFLNLWSQTPGQSWLAGLLRLPVLKQLMRLVYNVFAWLLYRWNRAMRHW